MKLQEMNAKSKESMDNIKLQIMTYANQIQEYPGTINAEVKEYKFVVEKQGNDTIIDIRFNANIGKKE
jgi:hypothetical protein